MTPPRAPRLTRRQFAGAAGLALLGLAGCERADTGRWAGRSLLVATPGGAERLAFWRATFVPFARDTGCRVMEVEAPDPVASLRRQVLAGGAQWDVAALDAALLGELAADGLLTPLDYARLPRAAVRPDLALEHGVGVLVDTVAAAYRTGPFGASAAADWPGLWRLTAPRSPWTLPRAAPGLLEAALLADGVAPARLYPLDVPRALAALDHIRPGVSFWWEQPADPQ
ncbi:MAG TPA: extracellular solute-binding protein, partial [Thermomicrobiales bacterium]|nr:extracellular solute-binding protein [Thermomicrobiales bacterium]